MKDTIQVRHVKWDPRVWDDWRWGQHARKKEERLRGGNTGIQSGMGAQMDGWTDKWTGKQRDRERESNTARGVPRRESLRQEAGGSGGV